jgi:RIO kinase 1
MRDFDDKKIEKLEQKIDKSRTKNKRKTEDHAAIGGVLDSFTNETLNTLKAKGVITEFVGILSAGKEANVYMAYGLGDIPLAIKIYKIDPQNTKWMKNYIIGDPRFKKIGTSTHKIIYTWCSKEFKNLMVLYKHNIPVPRPISAINNVLVMEFIGDENGTPAPRLKDADFDKDPLIELNLILSYIKKMYLEVKLVHGDLSEYNILYYKGKQVIIDVSQAVSIIHHSASIYLQRDVKNILNYYAQYIPNDQLPNGEEFVKDILRLANA